MENQGIVKVKFPRETDTKSGWTIDHSFITRVRHSIPPDEDEWISSHEEVQAVLLALECIPAGIYTTSPKRPWVGLTDEDWDEIFGNALTIGEAIKVTEAKLKEKNT